MASFKDSLRNARLDAVTTAAGATAYLKVYTGSAPSKTASPTGTLLVSLPLPNPIASSASSATLTLSAVTAQNGAATGTPGYVRLTDSNTDDGTHTIGQFSAGIGSGEVSFSGQVNTGGSVSVTSFTFTEGNA